MLTGCGSSDDELRRAALDDAVATTLDGTVAFNLAVDASDDALSGFGDAAEPLAALLDGSSAAGVIEGDRVAFGLALAGADLAQVRVVGPGEQFVRLNLGALSELTTGEPVAVSGRLESALVDAGLDPAARDAVLAAARGEWVRLEGAATDPGSPSAATSVREALGALLRSADPVDHTGSLEELPFDGQLDVEVDVERALAVAAQALAGLAPSAVPTRSGADVLPGRVLVEQGMIRSLVLDLGPLASGEGGDGPEGEIRLVLDLRRLDVDEGLVVAPDVSATVTLDQLERAATAVEQLQAGTDP